MGHFLNRTLKDFVVRGQLALGRKVSFIPGWDCHGLPIELAALTSLGRVRKDVDRSSLRDAAQNVAVTTMQRQREAFEEFYCVADWKGSAYSSLDPAFVCGELETLASLAESGVLSRQLRPVMWSPAASSSVAEAEVEYADKESTAVFVEFPVTDCVKYGDASFLVWTTTPWTLFSNRAIAVNPSLTYCMVEVPGVARRLIVADNLLQQLKLTAFDGHEPIVVARIPGDSFSNCRVSAPFHLRSDAVQESLTVPVVNGSHVDDSSGTGVVHIAPGHGPEDFALGEAVGLDAVSPVSDDGKLLRDELAHLHDFREDLVEDAVTSNSVTSAVVSMLQDRGLLVASHQETHRYPMDWRLKTPIIFRATGQWYVDLENPSSSSLSVRDSALIALKSVRLVPTGGHANRLASMVQGRNLWCISRRRVWGVPIPAVYAVTPSGEERSAVLVPKVIRAFADYVQERARPAGDPDWVSPGELWESFDPFTALRSAESGVAQELLAAEARGCVLQKGVETLDIWFDSGTSWNSVLRGLEQGVYDPLKFSRADCPSRADLYVEGADQHRGWFQSSLLASSVIQGCAPYKALLTHGFVVDERGKKMSKSVGNVMSPSELIQGGKRPSVRKLTQGQGLGVDVLRWWVASSDIRHDIKLSATSLSKAAESLRKVRGCMRFLLGTTGDLVRSGRVPFSGWHELRATDIHVVHTVRTNLRATAENMMERYAFSHAVQGLMHVCSNLLSAGYFENTKDLLYCHPVGHPDRRSAQVAMVALLRGLCMHVAPLAPHLSEDVFSHWETGDAMVPFSPVPTPLLGPSLLMSGLTLSNWVNVQSTGVWSDEALDSAFAARCVAEVEGQDVDVVSAVIGLRKALGPLLEVVRKSGGEVSNRMVGVSLDNSALGSAIRTILSQDELRRLLLCGEVSDTEVVNPMDEPRITLEGATALAEQGPVRECHPLFRSTISVPVSLDDREYSVGIRLSVASVRCPRCWEFSCAAPLDEGLCARCSSALSSAVSACW